MRKANGFDKSVIAGE